MPTASQLIDRMVITLVSMRADRELRRRRKGRRTHRAPLGSHWHRGKLTPDHHELAIAREIARGRAEGYSWADIALGLMRERIKARGTADWSVGRVRRFNALASSQGQ